jgi:hypothetical protein
MRAVKTWPLALSLLSSSSVAAAENRTRWFELQPRVGAVGFHLRPQIHLTWQP